MAIEKLSATFVAKTSKAGVYADGAGLYLQVRSKDRKSWIFRYKFNGRPRSMGLGALLDVTLAEAREACRAARKVLKVERLDPIEHRAATRAARDAAREAAAPVAANTFAEVAKKYIAAHQAAWSNPKHCNQWSTTLATYAYPVIGTKAVSAIDTGDMSLILDPIWLTKPETAARVRGRIEAILDYARTKGWRSAENCARYKGHLQFILPARSKVAKVEHHAALDWRDMGGFMAQLGAETGVSARALAFAVLTAGRTGEIIGATWDEIDLSSKVWTVPAERMKAKVEHRVPLSDPALAVLEAMLPLKGADDGYVFPGGKQGKPLSNMSLLMALRRMGHADVTTHGMRSAFKDWTAEATGFPSELAEAALAHSIGSKVEQAYRRGDLFEKRRRLMDDWGKYCMSPNKPEGATVVPLRAAAGE